MTKPDRLSQRAHAILRAIDNRILISAIVGWELAIKVNLGKIHPASLLDDLEDVLRRESFSELAVTLPTAVRAGLLPIHHRDPFDRMLVAQAKELSIPILSADTLLDQYGVERIW